MLDITNHQGDKIETAVRYHYLIPVWMVIEKTKEAQLGDAQLNSSIWEVEAEEPGVQECLGYIASSRSAYII